jgi:hypothetical protein
VLETSSAEFLVGESTCQGDSGGPAIDETSGEIVGVVSRGGPTCDGKDAHNIYTRADVFLKLVDEAIAKSGSKTKAPTHRHGDAGTSPTHHPNKPTSDLGAACKKGSQCAAGVCVTEHGKEYCSRTCDAHDHCPAHFHCMAPASGDAGRGAAHVCVEQ